jgi:PAS domain S-box-containing protein
MRERPSAHCVVVGLLGDVRDDRQCIGPPRTMDLDGTDFDYRRLFDQNPVPIIVIANDSMRVVHVNDTAVEFYGYTREEFLSMSSTDLRPSEDVRAFVARFRDSSARGGPGRITPHTIWRHKRKDGSMFHVEVQRMQARLGGAAVTVAFVNDVTARVRADRERRRLEDQLHQSQKMEAVGLLAGGIAHDFNNVLSIILGAAQLAETALASGKPAGDSLSSIVEASKRAAALIRKLLAFSRDQALVVETIELGSALSAFAPLLVSGLGASVAFEMRRADAPLWVKADRSQVEQLLLNLSTNSAQAMPAGGRLIVETRPTTIDADYAAVHPWARPGDYAEIRVTDTGVGIDEATRLRVFEPFFTTKAQGTGLGLAVVHGIVEHHKGCVHIEGQPGVGTTVRILLPNVRPPPAAEAVKEASSPQAVGGNELLLVADDEPTFRGLIARSLTDLGYRVVVASDGEEAVREFAARADEIDLVLLDGVMPKLSGADCYERIRALKPAVKALLMTGYVADDHFGTLLASGGPSVLRKPFALKDLARAVRTCLDAS